MLHQPSTDRPFPRFSSHAALWRSAIVVTLTVALAAHLPAQQPAGRGERAAFLVLVGRDTFAVERVRRSATELVDDMWLLQQRTRVRSTWAWRNASNDDASRRAAVKRC